MIARHAMRCSAAIALAAAALHGSSAAQDAGSLERAAQSHDIGAEARAERDATPALLGVRDGTASLDRALDFFVKTQHPNGCWGTGTIEGFWDSHYAIESYYAWQFAGHAIACMALAGAEETPERRATLDRAVTWFCKTRMPKRGSDWDNDSLWSSLYGFVACVQLNDDPRFSSDVWRSALRARAKECYQFLAANQVPTGGWGYYDDPPFTERPKWATSFSTAALIPALKRGEELGWVDDPKIRARAMAYVRRCALPNGAYEYDLRPIPRLSAAENINGVKGSLGRIQVCNWALSAGGEKWVTPDKIRDGLESFFADHKFLDVARMRPIPHEAYYQNAGYFYYFGHYYAAQAINLLPVAEREALHARLRPHVVKTQRPDGTFCDYQWQSYQVVACTALAALALEQGLPKKTP